MAFSSDTVNYSVGIRVEIDVLGLNFNKKFEHAFEFESMLSTHFVSRIVYFTLKLYKYKISCVWKSLF